MNVCMYSSGIVKIHFYTPIRLRTLQIDLDTTKHNENNKILIELLQWVIHSIGLIIPTEAWSFPWQPVISVENRLCWKKE